MIVANTPQSHPDVPGPTTITSRTGGGTREWRLRSSWEKSQELRSGKDTLWDHCFEMPDKNLEADQPILDTVQAGTVGHKLKVGGNDQMEIYDFPGDYAGRFDGITPGGGDQAANIQEIFHDNTRTVDHPHEAGDARRACHQWFEHCRQFASGLQIHLGPTFQRQRPLRADAVSPRATGRRLYHGKRLRHPYKNTFKCIPFDLPFKPGADHPQADTSRYANSPGGRPPARRSSPTNTAASKCSSPGIAKARTTPTARAGSGSAPSGPASNGASIHIPRIGQEVIVAFLEGDPDQPIIVGSVYNAQQMPPYTLPDNKTQSGSEAAAP